MKTEITDEDALIIVDVQNDFCNGSLAVEGAIDIIPLINRLIDRIPIRIFTRDMHPEDHFSFSNEPKFEDKSWPAHCVKGTPGVEFHKDLKFPDEFIFIHKGMKSDIEEYSGFDNPLLLTQLKEKNPNITRFFIVGLATDYCVHATAMAAIEKNFEVVIVSDACKAVDIPTGSALIKCQQMVKAGIQFINSDEINNLDTKTSNA